MWKYISKPRQTKQQFKSWEGMVNLMNTCLVVNTLLLSIDIVTMGFVKNRQDVSQWGKHFVSYYWNTLPLSICAHGTVSIYATALLCILSFIDHNDDHKLSLFYEYFKNSMDVIGKGTVLNFWLNGITILCSSVFLMDDYFQFQKIRLVFRYSSIPIGLFLVYATYVIRRLFHGEPEETTHERSTSFNIEIPELEGGDDLATVLRKIDETFPQKYLSVFEEAFISVDQLRRLDACHMTEYLNIPLGHAMRICGYFG